jgi:hypothetical protein
MVGIQFPVMIQAGQVWTVVMNIALTVFVITCVALLLLLASSRWVSVLCGQRKSNPFNQKRDNPLAKQPVRSEHSGNFAMTFASLA